MNNHYEQSPRRFAVPKRLEHISKALRTTGQLVFILTLTEFAITLGSRFSLSESIVRTTLASSVLLPLLTLGLLGWYDSLKRRGNALYEELSDELQWHVQRSVADDGPSARPDIEMRVLLRTYVQATNLPLVPGMMGTAVYAAANIAFALFAVLPIRL